MRNEQEFKKRISEIAANIAGTVKEEYDGAKYNLPDAILARINASIANQKDLALAILDLIKEILANEPSMKGIEDKSGWNSIMANLERIAGVKAGKDSETPDVSADDAEKMNLPDLKEAFNRINRK